MAIRICDFSFRSSWLSLLSTARSEGPVAADQDPIDRFIASHQIKLFEEGVAIADSTFEWLRGKVEPLSQSRIAEGKGNRLQKVFDQIVAGRLQKVEKTLHPSKLKKVEGQFKAALDTAFEEALEVWVRDPNIEGRKQEAAGIVLDAYRFQLRDLDLQGLRLSQLPDGIGQLPYLRNLFLGGNQLEVVPEFLRDLSLESVQLRGNRLTSLPEWIWEIKGGDQGEFDFSQNRLTNLPRIPFCIRQLRSLQLGNNQLSSLPEGLAMLTDLRQLDLSGNCFQELPPALTRLRGLRSLNFNSNEFREMGEEIGQLTSLEELFIAGNQLQILPTEMRSLCHLRRLHIGGNEDLHEIPLAWGAFPWLLDFNWENTAIPPESAASLLELSRSWRWWVPNVPTFPTLLLRWQREASGRSNRPYSLEFIDSGPQALSSDEKTQVGRWLYRLQGTRDFRRNQARLADLVCSMLESLKDNEDFRESFFIQVGANLVHCQDRAAMSLNEIYTSWVLYTLGKEESFAKKVRLLLGVARTEALRKAVANTLSELGGDQGESVETFLYYETLLREELGLVSAIEGMAYDGCARREGISVEALKDNVLETHFKDFLELPQLKEMLASDPLFEEQWLETVEQLTDELDQFEDQVKEEDRSQSAAAFCSFQHAFEKAWATAVLECIEGKLLDEESRLDGERQALTQQEEDLEQGELEVKMTALEKGLEQIKSARSFLSEAVKTVA